MTETQRRNWLDRSNATFLFEATIVQFLWAPMLSAYTVYHLCRVLGMFGHSTLFWAVLSPVVYLFWITFILIFYCLEVSLIGLFWKKPRYARQPKYGKYNMTFVIGQVLYNRFYAVYSLPFMKLLLHAPVFDTLILRSYATKTCIGTEPFIGGLLWDPDLTIIGNGVVLGGDCKIVGHSMVRDENGLMIYQTAPVEFGDYCVIGGNARVEMGVKVGARSIVHSSSQVMPFTIIPPDEVWGGNPAVFVSKRNYVTRDKATSSPALTTIPVDAEICGLIATALSVPTESITRDTGTNNCEVWDSMGKMAIAAGLHDRLGINMEPEEIFGLNSVVQIEQLLAARRGKTAPASTAPDFNPDWLPLQDASVATATLATRFQNAPMEAGKKTKVAIAATFVAQPLASALQLWSRACACPVEVEFYDFNQVPQALLNPQSSFWHNRTGLNVILLRPEDLPEGRESEAAESLLEAIKTFVKQTGNALLVSDLPIVVSTARIDSPAIAALRVRWTEQLRAVAGVQLLGFAAIIEEIGKTAARDTTMELTASTPYTAAVYQRLGISLARVARQMTTPSKKVLAVDGDNTLWHGVVGEDGVEGIEVTPTFKQLQAQIKALKERGVLLVLVSKNAAEDVEQVFARHSGMVLRREDFAAVRINWKPKSENLRALATELNLGLDSFVLLDDSPAERLEVAANCPEVAVVPLDANPATYAETLNRLWLFDGAGSTGEDQQRTAFTAQENKRKASEKSAVSLESYLASLELKVEIRRAREEDLPRVHQLVQKTNQFNLSLKRRSLPEIKALLPQHDIWVLTASDRFGSYGMVGCCISRVEKDTFILDTLLLSCRALGRGIEEAFLSILAQQTTAAGAKHLRAEFVKGPRNQPMEQFLTKLGFDQRYEIATDKIASAPKHLVLEISKT